MAPPFSFAVRCSITRSLSAEPNIARACSELADRFATTRLVISDVGLSSFRFRTPRYWQPDVPFESAVGSGLVEFEVERASILVTLHAQVDRGQAVMSLAVAIAGGMLLAEIGVAGRLASIVVSAGIVLLPWVLLRARVDRWFRQECVTLDESRAAV